MLRVVYIFAVSTITTHPVYIMNTVCYTTEMHEAVTVLIRQHKILSIFKELWKL